METKPEFALTEDQQAMIKELAMWQSKTRGPQGRPKTDEQFAKLIRIGSGSMWCSIKAGTYFAMLKNPEQKLAELKSSLNRLRSEMRLGERFAGKNYIETDHLKSVFLAVDECSEKPLGDIKRIVVFLGPTGTGKSFLIHEIQSRFDNVFTTEARKGWSNKSSFTALKDICEAFGIETDKVYNPATMEDLLVAKINSLDGVVLAIDEGEFFGKGILDSLKRLINKTKLVILIAALPEAYDDWNTQWVMEAGQISRRTHIVVEQNFVSTEDAVKFLEPVKLGVHAEECAGYLAPLANEFGSFDFLNSVVTRLLTDYKKIDLATIKSVTKLELKRMGRDRIKPAVKGGAK